MSSSHFAISYIEGIFKFWYVCTSDAYVGIACELCDEPDTTVIYTLKFVGSVRCV